MEKETFFRIYRFFLAIINNLFSVINHLFFWEFCTKTELYHTTKQV